jgi:hypothetical protein
MGTTVNYAIHLNGTTQYFTVADDVSHDYATGDAFTFGLCFRLDSDFITDQTKDPYLWSRENQHSMRLESGKLVYYFNGAGGAQTWRTGVRLTPEKYHCVILTGSEDTDTTLVLYVDGAVAATIELTGGMPSDTDTALYVGVDYDTTTGQFLKGNICGWFQSADTAISAADALTAWNGGVYDADTIEAITGLDDAISFEENSGTTYDNAINDGLDGAGQGTPTWVNTVDPLAKHDYNGSGGISYDFTGVGQNTAKLLKIKQIDWKGEAIADGDELDITDWDGNRVFHTWAKADDTGEIKEFIPARIVKGLKTVTMDHGYVHVYID